MVMIGNASAAVADITTCDDTVVDVTISHTAPYNITPVNVGIVDTASNNGAIADRALVVAIGSETLITTRVDAPPTWATIKNLEIIQREVSIVD